MLTKLEIRRQLAHIALGTSIVLLLFFGIINALVLAAVFLIGALLSFTSKYKKVPVVHNLLTFFDREKDITTFPGKGAIFYILGSFLAVLLFPEDIAMASIMILALGDSVSRLVGPYGYLKHPFHSEKFLEGIIAGALAAFFGALFFVPWTHALAASIIAMLIEGIDIKIRGFKIDDNLTIPLVSGLVILVLGMVI